MSKHAQTFDTVGLFHFAAVFKKRVCSPSRAFSVYEEEGRETLTPGFQIPALVDEAKALAAFTSRNAPLTVNTVPQ
eukprot:3585295-Amphidinium_carterae.1